MINNEATICMIGDTGMGKSSFGNLYLQKEVFETSDSTDPVTLEAVAKSNVIDGYTRWAIDTEGLNDGQSINSVQIQNLAQLMRNYERGVNAIVVVLNGQYDRFSQGVKDIIKFAYNAFATKEALSHICVVFTRCYDSKRPNRETKRNKYMNVVRQYLSEVSTVPLSEVPEIPVFFVDCCPEEDNRETKENMIQFHGWVCSRKPLKTDNFKEAGFREDRIEEKRTKVSKGLQTRGDTTYEMFEDQVRTKIVPNNHEPPRFTEWMCIKKYEEPIQKVIIEKKPNVDLGYKYSDDGSIRYKVFVDQQRKIVRDLRTGKNIETGPWYNSSEEKKKEAGRRNEKKETRQRKFEKKKVCHHNGHSMFGFSSSPHTHFDVFHITRTEQRTVQTDYDGKQSYTDWLIVPGSENKQNVGGGREHGWTQGYEREI